MSRPKVAIVHDYLTQRGGAERVVLSMLRAYPEAPLFTSIHDPSATYAEFGDFDVRPSLLNRSSALRRNHRVGLPLYPLYFSTQKVDADVVICSSSGFAHGVRTSGGKIVYCHSPARWLYGEREPYLAGWGTLTRAAVRVVSPAWRAWDRRAMCSADVVLANSAAVRTRIAHSYRLEARVVPPPVRTMQRTPSRPIAGVDPGYLLFVGRLLAYKNVDAVVAAMTQLTGHALIVAGSGPESARLKSMAPANVRLLGDVQEDELRWLYANCTGVVSAAFEDFGLTPIEAASFGKPAAVLRFGGFLDTVIEGETGIFFEDPAPTRIADAIRQLLVTPWNQNRIAAHAATFSEDTFAQRLRSLVDSWESM